MAERELLQSTANTQMKGKVLEATLITHPILKAVHSGPGSTARERYGIPSPRALIIPIHYQVIGLIGIFHGMIIRALLPLIQRRDMLSLTHANLSQILASTLDAISQTQAAIADAQVANRQLTSRLLTLTEKRKKERRRAAGENDERYTEAAKELKDVKVKWEIMRNAVQAVIVGSGVDWSSDKRLREAVLACGEEVEDDDW